MVPPYGGRSHSVHSSVGAEELTDHRVHFHGLFLLDLLIGPENDTNGQQETRTRRITDRTQQVSTGSQEADEGTGEVGHWRNVVLEDLLEDFRVLAETRDLHACSLDLLRDILCTHVGGVNPELCKDHRTDGHESHIEDHVNHDLSQAVPEDVALLIQHGIIQSFTPFTMLAYHANPPEAVVWPASYVPMNSEAEPQPCRPRIGV